MARTLRFPAFAVPTLFLLLWSAGAFADPVGETLWGYQVGTASVPVGGLARSAPVQQKMAIELGGWGEVELGQTDGPARRLVLTSPTRAPVSDPQNAIAAKAAYYSPKLSGFQVGLSYAPVRAGYGDSDSLAEHMVEGAIRHESTLGDARLRLTAGGGKAARRADSAALQQSWTAGGQVALSGLTVDVSLREQTPVQGDITRGWSAGIFYQQGGPEHGWSLLGRLEHVQVGTDPGLDAWSTALRYRWSPKVSLSAELGTLGSDGNPMDGTRLLFGTRVNF